MLEGTFLCPGAVNVGVEVHRPQRGVRYEATCRRGAGRVLAVLTVGRVSDPSASTNVATEALRGSIGIAPTITKHQGDRIQILVARDLDFRQVYQLRDSDVSHQQ